LARCGWHGYSEDRLDIRMNSNLLEGERVRFYMAETKDASEAESRWFSDTEYLRFLDSDPPRPVTARALRAEWEASSPGPQNFFAFNIQTKADARLIGFIA